MTCYCEPCGEHVPRQQYVGHQRSAQHRNSVPVIQQQDGVAVIESAFKSRIISYRLTTTAVHLSVFDFMSDIKQHFYDVLTSQLTQHTSVKVNVELFGLFALESKGVEEIKSFNTKNEVFTSGTLFNDYYEGLCETLHRKLSEFQERDSGKILMLLFVCYFHIFVCYRVDSEGATVFGSERQQIQPPSSIVLHPSSETSSGEEGCDQHTEHRVPMLWLGAVRCLL